MKQITRCTQRALSGTAQVLVPSQLLSYANGPSTKPLVGMTIGQALEGRRGEERRDKTALVSRAQNIKWTYAEFQEQVDKLAASFLKLGLNKGDRVALWAPNCAEWVTTQFASAKAGLVLVSINPAYKTTEIEYALRKVECAALITSSSFKTSNYISMLRDIMPEVDHSPAGALHSARVPSLRHIITLDSVHHRGMHRYADILSYSTASDIADLRRFSETLDFDEPINIQYTSGTTGSPKATTLTHHNILNNAIIVGDNIGLTENDVVIGNPPLFHCMGMVMTSLSALERGACVVLPNYSFDAGAALQAAAENAATVMMGVPTMFVQMLNHGLLPQLKPKLTGLRTGIMAGSICPMALMKRVEAELGIKELAICYGMTETSPVSTQTSAKDPDWARTETVGRVVPHTEVKIVDPATNRLVPRGEKGELCTRGYCVMKGYWGDAAKTAESIKDGWMHTGDLAQMDPDGYIRIVGRIKDMIIRGGENVFPREVEDFLYTHPHILDVSVFGVSDEVMGEEIAADIILKDSGKGAVTAEDIRHFCTGKIAHYKIPKYIRFVTSFPQTGSGKIQKFLMKAELETELRNRHKHHVSKKLH